jgi:hypothetical protein
MYAYRNTEALPTSTQVKASILPALDVSNVVHWFEPNGTTRTGQMESLELIDGTWWAAAQYQLTDQSWVLENRHANNFFAGVGPEFPLQLRQEVWFKRGDKWQAATVSDFYLECNEWFAVLEWSAWYGLNHDEKPFCEVRTTQPELAEDVEYSVWYDDRNDYAYEDTRDSR